MFTTGGFKSPKPRLPRNYEAWGPPKARNNCSCDCGRSCSSVHDGSSATTSNLTSSPSMSGTGRSAEISRNSPNYSSGQSSHHGSQDDLESDLEKGIMERMESLVASLLQDEGRPECQDRFPVLRSEVTHGSSNVSKRSCDLSAETAREIQESHTHYQDQSASARHSFVRAQHEEIDYEVRSNKGSAGGHFPSTRTVFLCKENRHQILKVPESPIRRDSCSDFSADDIKLSFLSCSQKNGVRNQDSKTVHGFEEKMADITLRHIERASAGQDNLQDTKASNRKNATQKTLERMRKLNEYTDFVACGGQFSQREHLRSQEDPVQELRAIAKHIKQTSLFERSILERTNKPHMGLCKWLCQQGPIPSPELEMAKNDGSAINRLSLHLQNAEATMSCRSTGPSAGHVSETDFSSARPTTVSYNFVFPGPATSCKSTAAVLRSAALGPSSAGRRSESSCNSTHLGNTAGIVPDDYHCTFQLPPKRKTTGYSTAITFQRRSSISASLHVKCARNRNAEAPHIYRTKNDHHALQKPLPEQKSSTHLLALAGQHTSSSDGSKARHHNGPATKALIAQGAKNISVLLKPENSASRRSSRERSSYPPFLGRSNSPTMSTGSGFLCRIRRRQPENSGAHRVERIPVECPSSELDVCNQGQSKTELCNNWQATKFCPYGDLCRFAHGVDQLRCVLRHPRYKTRPCRMILHGKVCIYGHRCHFRHSLTTQELSLIAVVDVRKATLHERSL